MRAWPEITDRELVDRLTLSDVAFRERIDGWFRAVPAREFTAAAFAHALGYPWQRPTGSYVLHDDRVELLDALDATARSAVLARFVSEQARTPLLAFGSNAAPHTLRRKLGHFPAGDDRDVLVIAGHLHDFDVGASAHLALYGALPATIFASPGTAVRCAILWLTPEQFTQLTRTEVSYWLGRLETRFEADEPEYTVESVLGFVSRFGTLHLDGEPAALAAVPAQNRRAPAFTQRQLLRIVAERAYGADHTAEDLVRAAFDDFGAVTGALLDTVRRRGEPLRSERWTAFPAPPE